ncbi:MAG: CRISPR-associated endonuclease Cas2 [Thermoproteota archaeon]|jgi:CRISPR-associated protein Cas2|nr:CRISPR-associated endonuclease Cas2 [Thermoproteota archaeon]
MNYTLVIYDIPDDNLRNKISDACKRFGLEALQRSAYGGFISSGIKKELVAVLERLLKRNEGNIKIYTICKYDLKLMIDLGEPVFEKKGKEFLV